MGRKRAELALDAERAAPTPTPTPKPLSPVPRILFLLLLDLSGSMAAIGAITGLLTCLHKFREAVLKNSLLSRMLSFSVVGFADTPRVLTPYGAIGDFTPPGELRSGHGTAMGTAILEALRLQTENIEALAAQGIATQHSLIAILTDGEPRGEPHERMEEAAEAISQAEALGGFTFLPIAVEGGNMNTLRKLCSRRPPLGLDQVDFDTFFDWLLVSLREASVSQPGERIKVKNPIKSPENPEGWGYF